MPCHGFHFFPLKITHTPLLGYEDLFSYEKDSILTNQHQFSLLSCGIAACLVPSMEPIAVLHTDGLS